jgi:Recombination protein U.
MQDGKKWEDDFRKSFQGKSENRILRLYDTTNGFAGVANPCDFIVQGDYCTMYVELKSVDKTSLPFSNITSNQWTQLTNKSHIRNVLAGICVQYRQSQRAYFVTMQTLNRLRKSGKKSLSISDAQAYGIDLEIEYKRTRCTFDVYNLLLKADAKVVQGYE